MSLITDANGEAVLPWDTEDLHRMLDNVQPGESLQLDIGPVSYPVSRNEFGDLLVGNLWFGPRLTQYQRANTPRMKRIKWGFREPRSGGTNG